METTRRVRADLDKRLRLISPSENAGADYFRQADLSLVTTSLHVDYLRRREITTWAKDRSKPITVNVTMNLSEATGVAKLLTLPMLVFPNDQKL